jgi:hypothetical protein
LAEIPHPLFAVSSFPSFFAPLPKLAVGAAVALAGHWLSPDVLAAPWWRVI